jgi:hypothetical protein
MKLKIISALEKSKTRSALIPLKISVDNILKATEHTFNNNGLV